jgi:hypothetical protein
MEETNGKKYNSQCRIDQGGNGPKDYVELEDIGSRNVKLKI